MKNFCLNWAHCAFPPHPSPLLTPLPSSEFLINIIPLGKLWLKMKWCKVLQSLEKLELLELIVCSVLIYYFFFTHFCIKLIVEVPLKKLLRLSAFFFFQAIYPLVTVLLCVSQKAFFLSSWPSFLSMCLGTLKVLVVVLFGSRTQFVVFIESAHRH